ncbi:MAG: hypothetical protein ACI97A_000774 [Planctomycetota bacterium]|jgi:hypothetical protein
MTAIHSAYSAPLQLFPVQGPKETQANGVKADTPKVSPLKPDDAVFSSEGQALAAAESEELKNAGPKVESELTPEEKKQVAELKARDAEVKAHEQAHLSALGGKGGSVSYEYTNGPDGRRYVTGGEVPVSIGESPGGPEATIADAQRVARAAVAPAQPSGADQAARAKALQVEAKARQQLKEKQKDGGEESDVGTTPSSAAESAEGLIDGATVDQAAEQSELKPGETDENGRTKPNDSALNQPSS